jgi:hypothetical protein
MSKVTPRTATVPRSAMNTMAGVQKSADSLSGGFPNVAVASAAAPVTKGVTVSTARLMDLLQSKFSPGIDLATLINMSVYSLEIDRVDPPVPVENQPMLVSFTLSRIGGNAPSSGYVEGGANTTPFRVLSLRPGENRSGVVACTAPAAGKNVQFSLYYFEDGAPLVAEFPQPTAIANIAIDVAAIYQVSLDSFQILKTRAGFQYGEKDTDFVTFSAQLSGEASSAATKSLGSWSSGSYPIDLQLGPFNSIPGDDRSLTFNFAITNSGFASSNQQTAEMIFNAASDVSQQVLDAALPGYPWALINKITHWINEHLVTDCDGVVAADQMVLSSTQLAQCTTTDASYTETRHYRGSPSPVLCGDTSDYTVTWSLLRTSK